MLRLSIRTHKACSGEERVLRAGRGGGVSVVASHTARALCQEMERDGEMPTPASVQMKMQQKGVAIQPGKLDSILRHRRQKKTRPRKRLERSKEFEEYVQRHRDPDSPTNALYFPYFELKKGTLLEYVCLFLPVWRMLASLFANNEAQSSEGKKLLIFLVC